MTDSTFSQPCKLEYDDQVQCGVNLECGTAGWLVTEEIRGSNHSSNSLIMSAKMTDTGENRSGATHDDELDVVKRKNLPRLLLLHRDRRAESRRGHAADLRRKGR